MSLWLQLFIWSCWINATLSIAMVGLVLLSRPLTRVKLFWSASCGAVCVWSASLGIMSLTENYKLALLGTTFVTGASIWIPTFLFHTVHELIHRKDKRHLIFNYSLAAFLSILNALGLLNDVRPVLDFPYYTVQKPLYNLFTFYIYFTFIALGFILWNAAKKSPPLVKKQLILLLIGIELGYMGGQTTFPLVYGFHFFPWGMFFTPVYIIAVAYAMLKYEFFDFKVALKKLSLILFIYLLLGLLITPVATSVLMNLIHTTPGSGPAIIGLTLLFTLTLATGPLIYALLIKRSFWLKSHFSAGLAHELKSPLASIQGALEIVNTQIRNENSSFPEKTTEYLDIIQNNVDRLNHYVKDLLVIAKGDENIGMSLQRTDFDLIQVIRELMELYQPALDSKSLTFRSDMPEACVINGDRDKLKQAISNILSNAVKFSDKGEIGISVQSGDGKIQVGISDEGPGIPVEHQEKIFERFYQINPSTKGSGIGLTIAKTWIEAHGGRVWVGPLDKGKRSTIIIVVLSSRLKSQK